MNISVPAWRLFGLAWFSFSLLLSSLTFSAPPEKSSGTAKQHSVLKVVAPAEAAPEIPQVWLSTAHSKMCKVVVGEAFPEMTLPMLGGEETALDTKRGSKATVILFWHPDRWMARTALVDLERDVVKKYAADQVSVVGIAVHQPSGAAQDIITQSKVSFPQLLDTTGEALSKVGTFALPRLYVLDEEGVVVWFDIEYSEGSRRELHKTLQVLAPEAK